MKIADQAHSFWLKRRLWKEYNANWNWICGSASATNLLAWILVNKLNEQKVFPEPKFTQFPIVGFFVMLIILFSPDYLENSAMTGLSLKNKTKVQNQNN